MIDLVIKSYCTLEFMWSVIGYQNTIAPLIIVDVVDLASWFLDLIVLVECRHLLVPQNNHQPLDIKWSKSMGT